MLVENPILNSPYEEPQRYWAYEEGQPKIIEGRRPAGYYLKPRTPVPQAALLEEEFVPLELVNALRTRVKSWKAQNYPGITSITRQLLSHWNRPQRERRLFFCQLEAIETLIWLIEAPPSEKQGLTIPKDGELTRYALKMATGTGKTVAMAMLIAWQGLNKRFNPRDRRFSDAVLVVCPNLTVKERLQVLLPSHPKSYYERFDLVPSGLRPRLQEIKVQISNWHVFLPKEDQPGQGVVQRGAESNAAFCRRVLSSLGTKQNILVINDEAHHAYRPASPLSSRAQASLSEELRQATIWIQGLDKIHAERGINFCADFSATPFYLQGSGYPEGEPFPWIISDFGLVDAIESGIVKVPRMPVDDNTGALVPKYFRLWEEINKTLPASERQTARRRAKPEAILREAEGALATLASEWQKTFKAFQEAGSPVPPVMIVVCDNTSLAELVHKHIAEGKVIEELRNTPEAEVTVRIDTEILAEAEAEGQTKSEAAERLRRTIATVGKTEWEGEGKPPGRDVRCVVSVSMLTEGWDAPNVTQILGLRAFTSQLLCEQVVGRGLRRLSYDDLSEPEYVDIYGVPFEVIPVKKKPLGRTETEKISTLVRALPERKHLEITFPRVEGYLIDVRQRIRVDWERLPYLLIDPQAEPAEVVVKPSVGYRVGRPDRLGPGQEVFHDRNPFHWEKRLQTTVYEIAAEIIEKLKNSWREWPIRHVLFPQVVDVVWRYLEEKVVFISEELPLEEVALLRYREKIVERLLVAIEPDKQEGEPPILPILERFRQTGSTGEVLFRTVRPCKGTSKSHISHVVLDAPTWEGSAAYHLENMPEVVAYARNDHLDFVIPYVWEGHQREYRPDYLVRLRCSDGQERMVILELKGFETEIDRQKEVAARRWARAVNNDGRFGRWDFIVCKEPSAVVRLLRGLCNETP
ncbi:MAG: DEAD/DEAH box helicase family protein [Bacteroidia bacterium]|nr:DEAD/DEAH box helicase family protein [Bacteroidia bacterium]